MMIAPTRKQCVGTAIKANWWAVLIILVLFTGLAYFGGEAIDREFPQQVAVAE